MKRQSILVLWIAVLCATLALAGEEKPAAAAAGAPGAAEMEAMMKAMSPGEPHKKLAKLAGDFTYTSKMWMDPSQAPATSSGTMHGDMILGGRYVRAVWKGDVMGMPFEG